MFIRDYNLEFGALTQRNQTDMIVIHHTGGSDIDASAEQIHEWHLNKDWAGIGYHYVIRKDGTVENGRPEWAMGSHAYGENYHTLGIHVSGEFTFNAPTAAQINSCVELVAELCKQYDIPIDARHIVGHRDLMATDCPGEQLYLRLDDIINRAKNFHDEESARHVESIFDLARRYESANDPAAVGKCYGLYQFNRDTVKTFVDWLKDYPIKEFANYGKFLADATDFDSAWRQLGTVDPGHFSDLQDEFAKKFFYDETAALLVTECFHLEKHSLNLQAVVFARAIQHGIFGCLELFKRACPYPNLSYADDELFDTELITAVYDYLVSNPSFVTANESKHAALINRFLREMNDALA